MESIMNYQDQIKKLYKALVDSTQKPLINKKPLLVTGSHRSGSTWIGRVIEKSDEFIYLSEPTNFDNTHSISDINYRFQFIRNSDKVMINELAQLNQNALQHHKKALFKDPLAFFSVDTFIDQFDADVLISVRHPAAFTSSLKRLGWSHTFNHFLEQEELMDTYLYPFRDKIKDFAKNEKDVIEQGILLWNIINLNALRFKQKHPGIYLVRHEDLSLNPIPEFQKIFDYFDISFSETTKQYLNDTTNEENSAEAKNNVLHQLDRNSKANIYNFKSRLTEDEIARIRRGTETISHVFYDQEWWNN